MTITQTNKLNIAYKRLSGLVNSNPFLGTGNETIASNVQIGSSTIFGQAIDTDPAVTVNAGIAERKVFKLTAVPSGYYIEPGEGNDPQPHVWKLQEYQDSTSTWIDFQGQLIGSSFGEGYYPKLYRNFVGDNGTDFGTDDVKLEQEVAKLSELNWMVDYFAGTLWFQNLTSEVPTDSWVVVAYKYTGQYLDTVVGEGGGGGSGGGVITIDSTPTAGFPPARTTLTLGSYELFLLDAANENIRIELPSVVGNENRKVTFKRKDSNYQNKVYVMGKMSPIVIGETSTGLYTIQYIDDVGSNSTSGFTDYPTDAVARYLYIQNETLSLYCDGTKWHIV